MQEIAGKDTFGLHGEKPSFRTVHVHAAVVGGSILDPDVAALLVRQVRAGTASDPLGALSRREREVLAGLSRGRSNREIARSLSLSEETVKSYVSALLGKLGLKDRVQAAIFGLQQGLVPLREALNDMTENE
jgi:two-component system, NarL family, response regulator LiaR